MAKTVILTAVKIKDVQIMPSGAGFAVITTYDVLNNNGEVIIPDKKVLRYSSTAGEDATLNLPTGMENAINSMITAFGNAIKTLEGL